MPVIYVFYFLIRKFNTIKGNRMSFHVAPVPGAERCLNELRNTEEGAYGETPVVSVFIFLSPFQILYSLALVIHEFPVQQ